MSRRTCLSDAQQYVLQVIMNRGVIDQTDFKRFITTALNKFDVDETELNQKEDYSQFIREINESIKFYNFEIQRGVCEITGITFYCFVRQFDTCSIGKLSSLYQPHELKIFQIILSMIIESESGYISYNDIVNQINDDYEEMASEAQTQSKNVTKIPTNREIRQITDMFISHYWLMEIIDNKNMITLHGRALIELQQYLNESYDSDILENCFRCKKLILIGLKCSQCGKQYHRSCAKEIFTNHNNACMNCKSKFSEDKVRELKEQVARAKAAYNERKKS